jgi:Clp amino terminal domain, pathogenicity island component
MNEIPNLDALIASVRSGAATDEPLAVLAAAARARDELESVTEAVLDHFVTEARQAGCSWSQIGGVLGVSKQAAQQRHTPADSYIRRVLSQLPTRRGEPGRPGLFTRFTPGARRAIVLARDSARKLRQGAIGTEHLLVGLLGEEYEGTARAVLGEFGVAEGAIELAVAERMGVGKREVSAHLPFAPRSKKVLELTLREAVRLGHDRIGTGHLLLGLLRDGDGLAVELLTARGVDLEALRRAVTARLEDAA